MTLKGARAVTVATWDRELRTLGAEAEVARMVLLEKMARGVSTEWAWEMFRGRARAFTAAAAARLT